MLLFCMAYRLQKEGMANLSSTQLVRAAALVVAAGVSFATVACSGSVGVPDGFTSACEGIEIRYTKGFRPAKPVDFVGFRVESTEPRLVPTAGAPSQSDPAAPQVPTTTGSGTTVAAWSASFTADVNGVPCSGAQDQKACLAKIEAIRVLGATCDGLSVVTKIRAPNEAPSKPLGTCFANYLVYTRGDEVGVVQNAGEARALFGAVDSPQEALYLAKLSGENLSCTTSVQASYAAVEGGYEIVGSFGTCGRRIVQVSTDGAVKLVRQDDGC